MAQITQRPSQLLWWQQELLDLEEQEQIQQPVSNYSYFQVEGMTIGENWLGQYSRNVVEYRHKIHSAMLIAQAKYLERKGEKRVHNQRESLVVMKEKDDFLTVNPKIPSLALNKRRLLKESRGTALRGRVLERYFVIDNTLITFFENESDSDFKKNCRLEGAYVFVESRSQYSHDRGEITWHDQNCEHRVQIGLPERQQNPIYFYTNDLNEAKLLAARIYMSSTSKKSQISDLIRRLSKVEIIFRFQAIWNYIFRVYEKRLLKMISFQIMGINLNELATTGWLQREKIFRFWSGQVLKREKVPLLRSTFRYGQIKRVLDPSLYRSSLMVRESLLKLVRAFKNRRLQRHSAIQQDIQALLEEEEAGVLCKNVKILSEAGKLLPTALVKCEGHKYLTLQLQQDAKSTKSVDFYEQNPPIKFQLENISCMVTDFKMFDKSQKEYTLRIHGRCTDIPKKTAEAHNITPDELGLDILRKSPQEGSVFIIKVQSIELSIGFAKRFSLKADLRVKLRQARFEEQLDSSFYVNSRPYRINVPPGKDKGRMVLKGQDYTFVVDKLDPQNQNETFKMCLVMQRNSVPVTQFMKEFLFEEEFTSDKTFKYEEQQDLEVKCSDQQGNKMKIKFSVSKAPANVEVFERDGLRLLIGRYVIYQKRIALLKQINRDQTVDLQNLSTGTVKQGVKMKKVKMIEHSGVNIFDLNAIPKAIQEAKFAWTIELTMSSQRLVNIISSEIQNRQTLNSFSQRAYNRDKKRDIEGRIILSIVELMDLKLNSPYQVYARVTVRGAYEQAPRQVYETPILEDGQLSWVDRKRHCPNGFMLDLGSFFMEDVALIKFELFNRVQNTFNQFLSPQKLLQANKQLEENLETEVIDIQGSRFNNVLIGQLEMKSSDFINIHQYGKETCLILEGTQIPFTFMVIQSLFIPSNVTRIEYQLLEDPTLYLSPEHYFHLTYQLIQRTQDKQGLYMIPMGKFNPNYLEKLQKYQPTASPMLLDNNGEIDSRSSPMVAFHYRCSNDEELELFKRNSMRPEIEEGALIFKYLWKYRVQQSRHQAFEALQNRFWTRFLEDMSAYAQSKPFRMEIKDDLYTPDGDQNLVDPEHKPQRQQYQPIHIPGEEIFDWLKAKTGNMPQPAPLTPQQILQQSQQHVQEIEHVKQFQLMFYRIWGDETSQAYADTYYLIQSGISSSQRVQIWKDLLRCEVYESLEAKGLRKKYAGLYDSQRSVYLNLRDCIASKHDCLAFRQIDEDIEAYQFPPNYHSNQVMQQRNERREMRNVLKALIVWSRNKKLEGKAVNFSYTSGLMNILQRLLTIVNNEEDAFWILNGIVRMIPRLFSTEESCLLGGRNSVMRNEMTAFKAILRENLPQICDKLRLLGLPVDQLIYNPITSFYAHYFSTDVVLRLWDLIIFNLSNKDKYEKKRALWYFMAPAYWILKERQSDIINAKCPQEVYDLFMNGQAITYNPDWIVNDLKSLIKDIFVTRTLDQPASGLLTKLLNKQKEVVVVDHALKLEETRKRYEADLSLIFNSIEEENKQIGGLLYIEAKKMGKGGLLDYKRWRQHVMDRFKKVAIKDKANAIQDDLYIYEEPDIKNRNNLDLAKINLYIHQLQNLSGIKHFRVKLFYGNIAPDGSFQTVEERFDDEEHFFNDGPMSTVPIDKFFDLEYLAGYNHLKIEVVDIATFEVTQQCTCDLLVDLRELNNNRFLKKHLQMRNEAMIDSVDSYRTSFSVCVASLFLQTHTVKQHEDLQAKKNTTMSKFISSIKRKLPDRIDIFNKKNETEFIEAMKVDFDRIVQEEMQALQCFLPEDIAKNTINDNFNYSGGSFGNITLENLQYLVKQCFYQEWTSGLASVYSVMTKKPEVQGSPTKNKEEEEKNIDDGNLSIENLNEETQKFVTIHETYDNQKTVRQNQPESVNSLPFSLRNFLVSLVLMSHCTLTEKFDILYDLMDWNDGVADGLDMNALYLLVKTIFERNLYYCPSHELFNQLEGCFDISVSTVYQALWTQNKDLKEGVKLANVLTDPQLLMKDNYPQAVDVTEEVQETVNSYQSMFGNKLLDFNFDSSPFKQIGTLIRRGGELAEMTKRFAGTYRLVISYMVSGERYRFEVRYDTNGRLSASQDLGEKDDLDEYLKRNINKLYLSGRSKGISKAEFIEKTVQIPFLHDLLRVETLYRDRLQSTLHKKKKLSKELVILLNFDSGDAHHLLIFRFQARVMHNVEGEMQKLDGNTFRVLMTEAFEEDCISDIRFRMSLTMGTFNEKLAEEIKGTRTFFVKDTTNKWVSVKDHDRLVQFSQQSEESSEILMRLDFPKHQGEEDILAGKEEERDLAGFDCYSLYRHCDLTYEWRLCKIMQREPIIQQQSVTYNIKNPLNQPQRTGYHFWIEFLHHRKLGQKLWLKRRREEILFSARYSREQVRNYEQETIKYVRDIYKQVFAKK